MLRALVISLALTVLIETALAWAALRLRDAHDLVTVVLAQIITNPFVVLGAVRVGWSVGLPLVSGAWAAMLLLEAAAIVAEWLIYAFDHTFERPLLASAFLNAASFGIGLVIALVLA